MLRRGVNAIAKPSTASAVRAYTDYHHHKYPIFKPFWYGITTVIITLWAFLLSSGSMWYESNRTWKADSLRSWKRRLPHGFKWEQGPEVKSFFTNVPSGAE
jgi:hypothetical protein